MVVFFMNMDILFYNKFETFFVLYLRQLSWHGMIKFLYLHFIATSSLISSSQMTPQKIL